MFIDGKTQNRIHATPGESISHGTMRTQDLIPAFMEVIHDTPEYVQLMNAVPFHALEDKSAAWWDSEEASQLLESLFDTLDGYSPEGYSFGSHPGDGSDYGYWETDRQTAVQAIISAAEGDDWHVHTEMTDSGVLLFEFSKFTPAGQDFNFTAEMKDNAPDTLVKSVKEYYDSFDPDEEAYLWIGEDGHGKNGAPHRIKDIVTDMEAAEEMVYRLFDMLDEATQKIPV